MSETKSFVAIYFPETYVSYISVLVTYSNIYYIAIVRTFNLKLHQIYIFLEKYCMDAVCRKTYLELHNFIGISKDILSMTAA